MAKIFYPKVFNNYHQTHLYLSLMIKLIWSEALTTRQQPSIKFQKNFFILDYKKRINKSLTMMQQSEANAII